MKALSLWETWASYIALNAKKYETRHWSTPYRGLVAIHAGKRWTDEEQRIAAALHRQFPAIPLIDNPQLGAMLCICRLLDCVRTESIAHAISQHERALGNWGEGRFAWEMEVLEVFETPIPASGQQGLFDWELPSELLQKRVAIVGSRDYDDLGAVRRYVYSLPKDTTIISGGARGVDSAAEMAAKERGMRTVIIPVNQRGLPDDFHRNEAFARRAMIRNGEIVALSGSVVAFWDNESTGTKNTIEKAKKANKPVLLNPDVQEKPKQLTLTGFVSTYDEGAYIDQLIKRNKFVEDVKGKNETPFVWEKPWLTDCDSVWVWDGWEEGRRKFKTVPLDSPEAERQSRFLKGFFYGSNTQELREWLATRVAWRNVPEKVADIADLSVAYLNRTGAVAETVKLDDIVFTQDMYNVAIFRRYFERFTPYDSDNKLGHGLRFGNSKRVYLVDGTHRALVAKACQHQTIDLDINHYPESFEQACGLLVNEDDSEFLADVLIDFVTAFLEQQREAIPA